MKDSLVIYNTVSRNKEKFEPLHDPLVGMYVCGPTVYSDVHLAIAAHSFPSILYSVIYATSDIRYAM